MTAGTILESALFAKIGIQSSGTEIHLKLEIKPLSHPLICTMNDPNFIVSNLMEESISIQSFKYCNGMQEKVSVSQSDTVESDCPILIFRKMMKYLKI